MLSQLISITVAACSLVALGKSDLADSTQVKDAFNAAKGKVRIVLLVSPTCPACISGADVIRNEVVAKLKDKRLATFSVFIPMLLRDGKTPAVEAAKKMTDAGIPSFWDGNHSLGKSYAETVKLPNGKKIAWDVYFVYGPNSVWGDAPPKPDFWMHQLAEDDQCLDPAKFRAAVEKELKALK